MADGGLRQVQAPAGTGEATLAVDGLENDEEVQIGSWIHVGGCMGRRCFEWLTNS